MLRILLLASNILDIIKCMYYSENSELKITLLLLNIIVNTECQHSQNNAAGHDAMSSRYEIMMAVIFLISQPKHMLQIIKIIVSTRWFLLSKTKVPTE